MWAGHYLAAQWNTQVLVTDALVGCMVNIQLPITDPTAAASLTQRLLDDYNMYIVVYPLQGAFWTRLSAQIYLEQSDFVALGRAVLQLSRAPAPVKNNQAVKSLHAVTEDGFVPVSL